MSVKAKSPRTIGFFFFYVLSASVAFSVLSLTNFEYYLFRIIFFPNTAEIDYVGHLGPRTFRSTWGVPKRPTVKFT